MGVSTVSEQALDPHKVTVVIPAFGLVALTQGVVGTLMEQATGKVIVVDNGGDYEAIGTERVITPRENLGWLRGTNTGSSAALAAGADAVLWLNNDVRVSRDFVRNMAEAVTGETGVVAPAYDQHVPNQRRGFYGPAGEYEPQPKDHQVSAADGTALLVTAPVLRTIGLLDERAFCRHGWGAIEDFALRLKSNGHTFVVTERAYINHESRVTAKLVHGAYEGAARAEMWLGMRAKYGADWKRNFPDMGFEVDEKFAYLRHRKRALSYALKHA